MHACRESSLQPAGSLLSSDASIDDRDNITLHVVLQLQTSIYLFAAALIVGTVFIYFFEKKIDSGFFLELLATRK
jgi:hypothetical protein